MFEVVGISRFTAKKTDVKYCVISALKNHYNITDGYQAKEFWLRQENPLSEVFQEFGRYEIFFDETGKYMQSATFIGYSEIFDIVDIDVGGKK
jgi:hypothetical protein